MRALVLCAMIAGLAGCQRSAPAASGAAPVPSAAGVVHVDGEIDEPAWDGAARTGAFTDAAGAVVRPFSEARLMRDDGHLYFALYAADDDIRAGVRAHDGPVWIDDAFSIRITPVRGAVGYQIDVNARGVTMDARRSADGRLDPTWESGIVTAVDRDGTLDDASDEDEEWIVEAALPLASLGLAAGEEIDVDISRCDTPRGTRGRRCGSTKRRFSVR